MRPFSERPTRLRAVWGVFLVLCVAGRESLASPSYTITDLGAVPGASSTPLTSYVPVLGVNGAGQGYVRAADGSTAYAFQRSSADYSNVPNANPYIPQLFRGSIDNLTLNSQGWAVGNASATGNFVYKPGTGGGLVFPGDVWHVPASFGDINASNMVAGSFFSTYFWENGQKVYTFDAIMMGVKYYDEFRAAILDPTSNKWLDLNTQLPAGSGWFLTQALKIDDLGQIIGVGTLNGTEHEFLMTPGGPPTVVSTPEPGPLALASLVALSLLWRRVRRASRSRCLCRQSRLA